MALIGPERLLALVLAQTAADGEFAIVFAAMGVNMETAHFFKQVRLAHLRPSADRVGRGDRHLGRPLPLPDWWDQGCSPGRGFTLAQC